MRLALLMVFLTPVFGQDTLYMRYGDEVIAHVVELTPDLVKYRMIERDVVVSISKNAIDKVIFADGTEQVISNLPKITGKYAWKKVVLTRNPNDVLGLEKVKEIRGKSGWGGFAAKKLGKNGATRSLQKRAAKLGCAIVLVEERVGGMGTTIYGVAYR